MIWWRIGTWVRSFGFVPDITTWPEKISEEKKNHRKHHEKLLNKSVTSVNLTWSETKSVKNILIKYLWGLWNHSLALFVDSNLLRGRQTQTFCHWLGCPNKWIQLDYFLFIEILIRLRKIFAQNNVCFFRLPTISKMIYGLHIKAWCWLNSYNDYNDYYDFIYYKDYNAYSDYNEYKNGLILPTGQWYAPSAVIKDAWHCMVLHCLAGHSMVLHGIALYCMASINHMF